MQAFYRQPSNEFLPCSSMLHQGPCYTFLVKDFFKGLVLYAKIYAVIYSLPLLLFKTNKLMTRPGVVLGTLVQNTMVSSLFLAATGFVMKLFLCTLRNAWGRPPPVPHWIPAVSGFAGVLGFLFERESRQLELLYYVLPQVCLALCVCVCV